MEASQQNIKTVCQLSSLHYALDTRIFFKYAKSLSEKYNVIVVGIHPKKEKIDGVQILPFKEYKSRKLRIFTSWILIFFKALRIKADLYHIHDPELLPSALLLKLLGKRVIIDVHENIADDIFDKSWIKNKNITYRIFNSIEKFACKRIPVIIAEESYRQRYIGFTKDVTLINNYVEPEFFKRYQSSERELLNLYYIGIVLESRCILEIMSAMKLLHDKGIKVHFHCVGRVYTRIERLINSHKNYEELKDYLHFYGRMTLDKGFEISSKCGIGLCLIKPMKNSVDSKPTKLFEYMACGLPILTSNFPLYKSIVEENKVGLTVNPLSSDEISQSIQKMIEDRTENDKFSSHSYNIAESKYNWASEKSKLLNLYELNLG